MWNAIKSDLVEFVTTLQEDGTKVVSKVMGDEDEGEEEDESLILQEKKIADLKRSYESYGNPIKESNQQEYTKYLKKFDMSDFGGYIAEVFDEYPEVSRFYAELVPIKITPEEFWSRLYFRIKLITCEGAATFAEDDDDEELVWEEDTGGQKAISEESIGGTSQAHTIVAYKRRIMELESENAKLKSHVKTLAGRVEELEAAQKGQQTSKASASRDPSSPPTTGLASLKPSSENTGVTKATAGLVKGPPGIGVPSSSASSSTSVVSNNDSPSYSDSDGSGVVVRKNDWTEAPPADNMGSSSSSSSSSSVTTSTSTTAAFASLDDDEDDDWS